MCGRGDEAKGNPFNAAYCKKISSQVATEFKNALLNGKRKMTLRLVKDLEKEGNSFVYNNSVWKQMPRKKVMTRVRKSLRDHQKTGAKLKAVNMSTSYVDKEDTTCAEARNAEELQLRFVEVKRRKRQCIGAKGCCSRYGIAPCNAQMYYYVYWENNRPSGRIHKFGDTTRKCCCH